MTMTEMERKEVREMLTTEQVLSKIKISRTTLLRLEKEKLFPQGQLLTAHKKLWFLDDIIRWQKDLQDPELAVSKAVREQPTRRKKSSRKR